VIAAEKTCSRCSTTKPATHFGVDPRRSGGLRGLCLDCQREDNRVRNRIKRTGLADLGLKRQPCLACPTEVVQWRRDHVYCSKRCAVWAHGLRTKYGLSPAEYWELLASQGGGCAICASRPGRKRFPVDHDHLTGLVRGILCDQCNQVIGLAAEDPERLARAAQYVFFGGRMTSDAQ
jgi:hypothetical protein